MAPFIKILKLKSLYKTPSLYLMLLKNPRKSQRQILKRSQI